VADWLGWLVMLLFGAAGVYLIVRSGGLGLNILGGMAELAALTKIMVILVAGLTVINALMLIWVFYFVITKLLAGEKMPLITLAGLIFLPFLDWLLVEWFWDPNYLYGIGWQNDTSMLFMLIMYLLAAAIFYGFSAYRRRQGIDIDKVYQEIPVE
jgi:hypothetical protein